MSQIPKENVVFFLDVHSKYLSKGDVVKSIQNFIQEKMKFNSKSMFSAFYFTEGNTPVFHAEKTGKELSKLVENDWKKREKQESYFENGLFYCLSYLAEKAQNSPGNFRVVVVTDLPSSKTSEYTEALMNLVETVRMFPTFIDIIRIGQERFYKDDVKLRVITVICNGGLFYLTTEKKLRETLMALVRNKSMPELIEGQAQVIDEHQKKYFENLSKLLIPLPPGEKAFCRLCQAESCNYCNDHGDVPQICPKCKKVQYHECCAALYSWRSNIGLKHIFRCVECGVLLKLDEDRVYIINGETKNPVVEEIVEEETWTPPETEVEDIEPEVPEEPPKPSPLLNRVRKTSTQGGVRFCPICNELVKGNSTKCKKCGSPL